MSDPLDMPLRDLIARLTAPAAPADADPWIDARSPACPIPWRAICEAAKRGELAASRIGRCIVVRKSELDRWIAAQRITSKQLASDASSPPPAKPSRAEMILQQAGYRKS